MVTDEASEVPKPWTACEEPRPTMPSWLAAKVAKCFPQHYTNADITIWIDGNIEILSPDFVSWCLKSLGESALCQHRNFAYRDIYHELEVSETLSKYTGVPLKAQVDHYIAQGLPPDYGTWWGGLIIRAKDCPDFGTPWFAEMVRWGSSQDQLSYPYVMHAMDFRPKHLEMDLGGDMRRIDASHWVRATPGGDYFNIRHHSDGAPVACNENWFDFSVSTEDNQPDTSTDWLN